MKIKATRQTQNRLKEMIEEFVTAGLRVFVGEQSAEYVLFKKIYPGPANY
jgi:predicted peroxiredoxin